MSQDLSLIAQIGFFRFVRYSETSEYISSLGLLNTRYHHRYVTKGRGTLHCFADLYTRCFRVARALETVH